MSIIKVRCLHHNRFWLAGSENVVSLAGSFTIYQTAVDSPYLGEAENLIKTPILCKNAINFFVCFFVLRKRMFCKWDVPIVPCVSFQNALFCGLRGLTFTWWGRCGLRFWYKPTELTHSFFFSFVLLSISCVFMTLSTVFHSINSPDNSPLSHCVLPVLFLPYWSF